MKILIFIFVLFPFFINSQAYLRGRYMTMDYWKTQKQENLLLKTRVQKTEEIIWFYSQNNPLNNLVTISIPVVFHVVYLTPAGNIPDTFLIQLLNRINEDYRKLNSDWTNTPSVWQPLVADCEIEFCLATLDTNGNATSGIERRMVQFSPPFNCLTQDYMFYNKGGLSIWDSGKYLNIWVTDCSFGGMGYSSFPGGNPSTDGIVLNYQAVPGPQSLPAYNMGRVATHEIGHWLGLYHIWGDDGGSCSGSDQVADTPNQADATLGCPFVVNDPCSPSGIMFMNYMDETDDSCKYMFTSGQKSRMWATLNTVRNSLFNSAATNCFPTTINETDIPNYISIFPNPSAGKFIVDAPIDNGRLVAYDIFGKPIYQAPILNKHSLIDLSSRPKGIYFLQLTTDGGKVFTEKVVVQ